MPASAQRTRWRVPPGSSELVVVARPVSVVADRAHRGYAFRSARSRPAFGMSALTTVVRALRLSVSLGEGLSREGGAQPVQLGFGADSVSLFWLFNIVTDHRGEELRAHLQPADRHLLGQWHGSRSRRLPIERDLTGAAPCRRPRSAGRQLIPADFAAPSYPPDGEPGRLQDDTSAVYVGEYRGGTDCQPR